VLLVDQMSARNTIWLLAEQTVGRTAVAAEQRVRFSLISRPKLMERS
jgi:hypothetical protein